MTYEVKLTVHITVDAQKVNMTQAAARVQEVLEADQRTTGIFVHSVDKVSIHVPK